MLTHRHSTIIGDIPDDWETRRLRRVLIKHAGGDWGNDEGEEEIRVLRSTNFTDSGYLDFADVETRYFKQEKAAQFALKENHILLERSGGGPTQPVGRIGIVESDLPRHWFSNFVQLLQVNRDEIEPHYLAWVLFELNRSGIVERLQHQTTQMRNLDFRDYIRVIVPRPPRKEQQKIALFVATASKGIEKAKLKLDAARRLKTALMQQLFTRGLPGRHARFQQREIGEFPETWVIGTIQSLLDGWPFNGVSPQSRPDPPGAPILNVECIDDGFCKTENVSYVDVDAATLEECRARRGDFYVLRGNGNREYVATGGYLAEEPPVPTIFSDKLIRLRFQPSKLIDRFLPYLWQSHGFLRRLQSKAVSGSGLWMIGKRDIRREIVAYPACKDEQQEIVSLIDTAIENMAAIERELHALDRLKRSLLQNLLTGQVRVRSEV